MLYKKDRAKIRQDMRTAIKLYEFNLLTQSQLRELAANALMWEIATSLEEKIERKARKVSTLWGVK